MNDRKLKKLFDAARNEVPPGAPEGFDLRVMAAVRREQRAAPASLWEQLEELFPRLATAAVAVIVACLIANLCFAAFYPSSLTADLEELSGQGLFAANGEPYE